MSFRQVIIDICDDIYPEGMILDGFDDRPRSATRKHWFRITRELIQQTIADMDLYPPREVGRRRCAWRIWHRREEGLHLHVRWLPKVPQSCVVCEGSARSLFVKVKRRITSIVVVSRLGSFTQVGARLLPVTFGHQKGERL